MEMGLKSQVFKVKQDPFKKMVNNSEPEYSTVALNTFEEQIVKSISTKDYISK